MGIRVLGLTGILSPLRVPFSISVNLTYFALQGYEFSLKCQEIIRCFKYMGWFTFLRRRCVGPPQKYTLPDVFDSCYMGVFPSTSLFARGNVGICMVSVCFVNTPAIIILTH